MSEAIIREIARQIVQEQLLQNWLFYSLLLALLLVGSVISGFITSYIRKRGETYATRADLAELVTQLRATTEAAEQVKTAIAHNDWTIKEWKTLRRIKLEELVENVYALRLWLDKERSARIYGGKENESPNPVWKLELVSRLYFPELQDEIQALAHVYHEYDLTMIGIQQKLSSAGENLAERGVIFDSARTDILKHQKKLLSTIAEIEGKAPVIMNDIVSI
jgi:hypothetical protein